MAERLRAAEGYVAAMRAVVPLRDDVELRWTEGVRDDAKADELAAAHRIESPVGRLRTAIDEVLR